MVVVVVVVVAPCRPLLEVITARVRGEGAKVARVVVAWGRMVVGVEEEESVGERVVIMAVG